jgi:hypothetical protein
LKIALKGLRMRQTTLLFQGSGLENIKIISQETTGLWGTIRAFLELKIVPGGFSPAPRLYNWHFN